MIFPQGDTLILFLHLQVTAGYFHFTRTIYTHKVLRLLRAKKSREKNERDNSKKKKKQKKLETLHTYRRLEQLSKLHIIKKVDVK